MPSPARTYNEHGVFLTAQPVWSGHGITLMSLHRWLNNRRPSTRLRFKHKREF